MANATKVVTIAMPMMMMMMSMMMMTMMMIDDDDDEHEDDDADDDDDDDVDDDADDDDDCIKGVISRQRIFVKSIHFRILRPGSISDIQNAEIPELLSLQATIRNVG